MLEAKVTPDGPIDVGSTYHYTSEVMGHRMQTQLQVSAFEPNKKWGVKTTGVPTPVETVYLFEAAGSGTKLTSHTFSGCSAKRKTDEAGIRFSVCKIR